MDLHDPGPRPGERLGPVHESGHVGRAVEPGDADLLDDQTGEVGLAQHGHDRPGLLPLATASATPLSGAAGPGTGAIRGELGQLGVEPVPLRHVISPRVHGPGR